MKLKALRKLEEMEIRQERDQLTAEQKDLKGLLKDEDRQWKKIGDELSALKKRFGPDTALGKRRTKLGDAPTAVVVPLDTVVGRTVTIVCSDKGWVRALKGTSPGDDIKYRRATAPFFLHAETTDKLLVFGTNGRFYTLGADKLPGGRGHGEPLRLMIELGNDQDVVNVLVHKPGRKLLVASSDGRGYIVPEDEAVADQGRQAGAECGRGDRGPGLRDSRGRPCGRHRR
jgi:topoisomerase-4 subunit A